MNDNEIERHRHRIGLIEARKISNRNGIQFTDDEINKIVNDLYGHADIEAQTFEDTLVPELLKEYVK